MFRTILFLLIFVSCAFKVDDSLKTLKTNFEDNYFKTEAQFGFLKKTVLTKDSSIESNIQHSRWIDAQSRKKGELYPLGKINPNNELHLLISSKKLFGLKPEEHHFQAYNNRCVIQTTMLKEFSEKFLLEHSFDGILNKIRLGIGENEYSLKFLYDEDKIEVVWIDLNDDDIEELYIAILDISSIKKIESEEDIYFKLYSLNHSIYEGVKILNFFHHSDDWTDKCFSYAKEMAQLNKLKLTIKGLRRRDSWPSTYWMPSTIESNLAFLINEFYWQDDIAVDYYQDFSIDIRSIITQPKPKEE